MNGEIRVAELFAGIGGFRLGLERANHNSWEHISEQLRNGKNSIAKGNMQDVENGSPGLSKNGSTENSSFRCVWANEWDKYACQIYRKNFGSKELFEGDIREVNTNQIPDIDLLVGGFPCQSFSLAGKRKGTTESRGTLFSQIVRVASAKRPRLLLLENVKGLLSSDNGRDFAIILRVLGNLGYLLEWQVLNSKWFLPQNRERIFIIGHLRGECARQIFPIGETCFEPDKSCGETQREGQRFRDAGALRSTYYKGYATKGPLITANSLGIGGSFGERNLIANTLSHRYGKDGSENLVTTVLLDNLGGNIKDRIRENGDAWTLGGSQTAVVQKSQIRRLTPTECERLQGFPDGWTEGVSDTQRYKCLGNAVTAPVIQLLGEHLLACKQPEEV